VTASQARGGKRAWQSTSSRLDIRNATSTRRIPIATTKQGALQRAALRSWLSCARRCRLEPFKRLAKTVARGFRTVENFIAIAYLRMSKLKHLPANPFVPPVPRSVACVHRCYVK